MKQIVGRLAGRLSFNPIPKKISLSSLCCNGGFNNFMDPLNSSECCNILVLNNSSRCFHVNNNHLRKDLSLFEIDIHNFFLKKNQILESNSFREHYENVVLGLLECPTNIKYNKSTYFVAAFMMECIFMLNLQKDREYLLEKALDLLNAGTYTELEISQKNALMVQIATSLQDVEKMKNAFDIFFKHVKEQLTQHSKFKKPLQLQLDDIIVGFSCAPHVGRYAEMSLLGNLIVDVFKAPQVLEFLNDQANTEQQIDYSAIYNLLKAYPIPNEPPKIQKAKKFKSITSTMKISAMVCSMNSEKEESIPNDVGDYTQNAEDLLEVHQW